MLRPSADAQPSCYAMSVASSALPTSGNPPWSWLREAPGHGILHFVVDQRSETRNEDRPVRQRSLPRRRLFAAAGALLLVAMGVTASVAVRSGQGLKRDLIVETKADVLAPAFELDDLRGGGTISLSQFTGRPVVINFFASWCVPCRKEMPGLQAASHRFEGSVSFLGVDHEDSRNQALELVAKTGVTYPTAYDPDGRTAKAYMLRGLPSTVFVSPDGRIVATRLGELKRSELEDTIVRLFGVDPAQEDLRPIAQGSR